jgi:hypothetical protein
MQMHLKTNKTSKEKGKKKELKKEKSPIQVLITASVALHGRQLLARSPFTFFTSPTGEARKTSISKTLTPSGSGQSYTILLPSICDWPNYLRSTYTTDRNFSCHFGIHPN